MSGFKIDSIINSEFHSSMDDTIINRLAEALFCENQCHEEFWLKFKNIDLLSIKNLKEHIDDSQFSHPNIIRIIVAILRKHRDKITDVENILMSCIDHCDPDYCYSGLWCCLKLINQLNFYLISPNIFKKYINNNNVIFEPIFEELIVKIYFKALTYDKMDILQLEIEKIIFNNIENRLFLLISILVENLNDKHLELNSIKCGIENIHIDVFLSNNELIYCYMLFPNSNIDFEKSIIKILDLKNDNEVKSIIKSVLHLSSGITFKKILNLSLIGSYLWERGLKMINRSSNSGIMKEFVSLGRIDSNLIPHQTVIDLINNERFDAFNNIFFTENQLIFIANHFVENQYSFIFDKELTLMMRYFVSIFDLKELSISLSNDINATNSIVSVYDNILRLLKISILNDDPQDILVESYLTIIKCCFGAEHLTDNCKIKLIKRECGTLITLQKNILQRYIQSECLDLLSTQPIRLCKDIFILCLANDDKCKILTGCLQDFNQLVDKVINTPDLYDSYLYEYILFCTLSLYSFDKEITFKGTAAEFVNSFMKQDVIISINDFLTVLKSYMVESIDTLMFIYNSFKNCVFRKDSLTEMSEIHFNAINNIDGILLETLKFDTEFCKVCKENIDELIEDISISAKPMDCFGD